MITHDVNTVWRQVCEQLEQTLHGDVYARWIAVIEPQAILDDNIVLAVDNDFYQSWLEENYLPLIQKVLHSVTGHEGLSIRFTVRPCASLESANTQPVPVTPKRGSRARTASKSNGLTPKLNPRFTLDSFIIGPSNSFAHAASLAVAQAPARAYNPLFMYGGVGLGKTHLMQAIGHYVIEASRCRVCYLSAEELLNEYIEGLTNRSLPQFRKKYRNCDVLLIDDIHFLGGKDRIQEEFFHTFNALFNAHRQIVMTSDRPASEISGLEQRLVSRFEWGLVTELETPDLETRIAILRHKQRRMNLTLDDSLIVFIAENIKANVRRLEGALVRAVSYASLMNEPLTVESLRHLLKDTLDRTEAPELSFNAIQRAVAEHYDIRLADMSSKKRPHSIAAPRQVAMYLCRRLTDSSFPDIANAFGKTHATILHACRSVDSRMDVDAELRRNVTDISRKLGLPIA